MELNRQRKSTTALKIELVKKYDEMYGTLMFQPSCTNIRMSPGTRCCDNYIHKGFKSPARCMYMHIGRNVSSEKIPDECPFSVLNNMGGVL